MLCTLTRYNSTPPPRYTHPSPLFIIRCASHPRALRTKSSARLPRTQGRRGRGGGGIAGRTFAMCSSRSPIKPLDVNGGSDFLSCRATHFRKSFCTLHKKSTSLTLDRYDENKSSVPRPEEKGASGPRSALFLVILRGLYGSQPFSQVHLLQRDQTTTYSRAGVHVHVHPHNFTGLD